MPTDWKDMLSSLRGNLQDAPDSEINEDTVQENNKISQSQRLNVVTDKKQRKGKTATIIEGFTIPKEEVEDLARKMKQKFGVGGSVRDGEILIQGDYKKEVIEFLNNLNFKTNKC